MHIAIFCFPGCDTDFEIKDTLKAFDDFKY